MEDNENEPETIRNVKKKLEDVKCKLNQKNVYRVFKTMAEGGPSVFIVIGSIGRGKSCFVMSYLKYAMEKKVYDEIIVISSTIFNGFFTKNGISNKQQIEGITNESLLALRDYQRKQKNPKHILLTIDDSGDNTLDISHKNAIFTSFITTIRHYNISVILIVQHPTLLAKKIRGQATGLICFDITGQDNLKALYNTLSCGESFNQFTECFYEKCKDNGCLFVNSKKNSRDNDRIIPLKINIKEMGIKI